MASCVRTSATSMWSSTNGLFHLFHLVLPNHDFIAHAVSEDGLNWQRVKNALFVGEPGAWDDDMLWTMHVSADPDHHGRWRMFYTGLSRREYGRIQRVGMAVSDDLLRWERIDNDCFPLEVSGEHYESSVDEGRKWVSFRDPYFFLDPASGRRLLLSAARVNQGPLVRRGCVGVAEETKPNHFVFHPPLHRPGLYDDVEVPNLFNMDGRYFLLGSIREDTKVHYWYSDSVDGPYQNFFDNVLLPSGNYAARVCRWEDQWLLFAFFAKREQAFGREICRKLLPPPKLLVTDSTGRLRMKSYPGFDGLVRAQRDPVRPDEVDRLFNNPHSRVHGEPEDLHVGCISGYEAFLLPEAYESFRLRATIELEGSGKCGVVLRVNDQGDGYYLSLDLIKGVAQLRAWGANGLAEFEHAFKYQQLQAGHFVSRHDGPWDVEVVAHGMYLEVSIDGYITLSVVDDTYGEGRVGFYTESAKLQLSKLEVQRLSPPRQEESAGPIYTSAASSRPADMGRPTPVGTEPLT